jgi:hypothetical protein
MRSGVVLAVLVLLLPMLAWADGINIVNQFGTIVISDAGLISSQSELKQFNHIKAGPGHSLGKVDFATGAFSGTDLFSNGTFSDVGSSFVVTGNGTHHVPNGTIFSGAFVGPITWTVMSQHNQTYVFQLSGNLQGQLWTGHTVTGTTSQTIYAYKNQWLQDGKGSVHLGGGHFVTPEPSTLGLLGLGLLGTAGLVRRKLVA